MDFRDIVLDPGDKISFNGESLEEIMNHKKVAYVAGKYRADTVWGITKNIQAASKVSIELWKMGYAVICPHRNTALFDGAAPDSVWLEGDLELVYRSDIIVTVPNWEQSSGAKNEIHYAGRHGILVYHWPTDVDQIRKFLELPNISVRRC